MATASRRCASRMPVQLRLVLDRLAQRHRRPRLQHLAGFAVQLIVQLHIRQNGDRLHMLRLHGRVQGADAHPAGSSPQQQGHAGPDAGSVLFMQLHVTKQTSTHRLGRGGASISLPLGAALG